MDDSFSQRIVNNKPLNISSSTAATSRPLHLYRNPKSQYGKLSLVQQSFGDLEPPEPHPSEEDLIREVTDNYNLALAGSGILDFLTGQTRCAKDQNYRECLLYLQSLQTDIQPSFVLPYLTENINDA